MHTDPVRKLPTLAIIFPCYNEEAVLPATAQIAIASLDTMIAESLVAPESFLLFVDDGSTDTTWHIIRDLHERDKRFRGLRFGGNAGHQNALLAGMHSVANEVSCAVTMDADLQDDITLIPDMVKRFMEGNHIVYGVRGDRTTDTWFKRNSANLFYSGMRLMGVPIIPGHADFRLVSSFAMQTLDEYSESNVFLRSIFPGMKLRSSCVYYARQRRLAGETKYPFWKMVAFAVRGVTVCSPIPLRLAGILSLFTLLFAILQSVIVLRTYFSGQTVPGWTSFTLLLLYLSSVQLLCLGILGEYIAKIFTEVKKRPRYRVEEICGGVAIAETPQTEKAGSQQPSQTEY